MSRRRSDENSAIVRLAQALHPSHPQPDRVVGAADAVAVEVVRAAGEHRVSGLLARALERAGRFAALPEAARSALRADFLGATHQRAVITQSLLAAAAALTARGVEFLLLKGAALGGLLYDDPSLRPLSDVDLLVRPEDLGRALTALGEAGFEPPSTADQAFWRSAYFNLPVRPPAGLSGAIEIHWSLAQGARQRPDVAGLFARAQDVTIEARRLRALGPVDLLLHQALHLSYHYFEPKLLWLYDLALLGREPPPVAVVSERAGAWGMTTPLSLAVLQVEKAFPGIVSRDLLLFAAGRPQAAAIRALLGSRRPLELIAGWDRRWRQLVLAALMLDRPTAVAAPVASWLRRTVRYGDRAGRRRGAADRSH